MELIAYSGIIAIILVVSIGVTARVRDSRRCSPAEESVFEIVPDPIPMDSEESIDSCQQGNWITPEMMEMARCLSNLEGNDA